MKKKVTELVTNPINPRKISKENFVRLQQSIMLFPKMLYYSDIIISSENVILAGNQRVSVLQKILNSSFVDWALVLQGNDEWNNFTESQKDVILNYWKKWCENPVVDCTLFDENEEDQKRLIYLDNKNFGEFEAAKLLQIANENTLINYGFDESYFYCVEDDENVIVKSTLGKGRKINVLTFGRNSIAVRKEEYEQLVARYEDYVENNGVDFGFIRSLFTE